MCENCMTPHTHTFSLPGTAWPWDLHGPITPSLCHRSPVPKQPAHHPRQVLAHGDLGTTMPHQPWGQGTGTEHCAAWKQFWILFFSCCNFFLLLLLLFLFACCLNSWAGKDLHRVLSPITLSSGTPFLNRTWPSTGNSACFSLPAFSWSHNVFLHFF